MVCVMNQIRFVMPRSITRKIVVWLLNDLKILLDKVKRNASITVVTFVSNVLYSIVVLVRFCNSSDQR